MRMEVVFILVVRPLFRGGRLGLKARMAVAVEELEKPLGFHLALGEAVVDREGALRMAQRVDRAQPDLLVLGLVTFVTGETLEPLLSLPFSKLLWALPEAWEGGPLPQNALCGLNLALSLPGQGADPQDHLHREHPGGAWALHRGSQDPETGLPGTGGRGPGPGVCRRRPRAGGG